MNQAELYSYSIIGLVLGMELCLRDKSPFPTFEELLQARS